MSLVNSSIANLVNGVSQQPYALRLPSQAQEQINAMSSVVEGLRKRPPTRHEFLITEDQFASSKVLDHQIDRDNTEQYKVLFSASSIKVLNLKTKEQVPVAFKDGRTYLNCSNPATQLRAVTVADHTFVLNRSVTVRADATVVSPYRPEAIIWVRQGSYGCKYRVSVDGHRVIWTTPDGTSAGNETPPREEGDQPDTVTTTYNPTPPAENTNEKQLPKRVATDYIAGNLYKLLKDHPKLQGKFTFYIKGSTIRIQSVGVKDKAGVTTYPEFTVYGSDSLGDTVLRVLKDRTKSLNDLPARCFNGFRIKIMGDSSTQFDDYYVRYSGTITAGVWIEDRADSEKYQLNAATMPHVLKRLSDGTFSFEKATWDTRLVGDTKSNPLPSFVDRKISDLFFYSNRFGVIAEDKVVMSRFGDFYNFFKSSATQLIDTDPIDVAVSHTKAIDLSHALAYQETLTLFSDGVQFQMREAETTTAKTVGFAQTTEYACSKLVRPVAVGSYLYFTHPRGEGGSAVREYLVSKGETASAAQDITAHVPKYIRGNIDIMAASASEDVLVCTATGAKNVLYVYKYFWSGDEKLQSSWSQWVFEAGTEVLSASFIGSTLWLSVIRGNDLTVESCDLSPVVTVAGQDFDIHLDRRFSNRNILPAYNQERNETTIKPPFTDGKPVTIIATGGDDFSEGYEVPFRVSKGTLIIDGRLENYHAGVPYETRYVFSTLTLKQESGTGEAKSIIDGRLQLRKMVLEYSNSGYFRVKVTPVKRTPYVYPFTAKVLGVFRQKIGRVNIESGHFQFPILSRNDQVTIEIINDNFLPFAILSAEWEGIYTTRSRRL